MNAVNKREIEDRVIGLVSEEMDLPVEKISLNSTFDELNIDSLYGLNIILDIENLFDIQFNKEATAQIKSLGDLAHSVEKAILVKNEA
jgi:acyl carrier protein